MSGGRLLRYSLAGLCIALAAFFLLPLAIGAHHIGMFFPAAVLGVLAWMLLRPQKLKMLLTGKGRILWRSLLALFAAGLLCVAVILGLMARQAADRPEAVGSCTVLVLGCEVRGLRPSKMLAARIDSAYDYLTANPEAVCVACGGIGEHLDRALQDAGWQGRYIHRAVKKLCLPHATVPQIKQATGLDAAHLAEAVREADPKGEKTL